MINRKIVRRHQTTRIRKIIYEKQRWTGTKWYRYYHWVQCNAHIGAELGDGNQSKIQKVESIKNEPEFIISAGRRSSWTRSSREPACFEGDCQESSVGSSAAEPVAPRFLETACPECRVTCAGRGSGMSTCVWGLAIGGGCSLVGGVVVGEGRALAASEAWFRGLCCLRTSRRSETALLFRTQKRGENVFNF